MLNALDVFNQLSWLNKIKYIVWFYQWMIKKTNNLSYIAKFQVKIDEIMWYNDSLYNNKRLTSLYERIILAKKNTKQVKNNEIQNRIKEQKQKLVSIESNNNEQDPDEYLAESMANI